MENEYICRTKKSVVMSIFVAKVLLLPQKIIRRLLKLFPKHVEMSLGDLMLQRADVYHLQFSVSALILDIDNYCKGDKSFYYQNVSKKKYYGSEYDIQTSNKRFSDVIDSVMKDGFRSDSTIETDKHVRLIDGTHRTAIMTYFGVFFFKAKIYPFSLQYYTNADAFIKDRLFDSKYVSDVWESFGKMQQMLIQRGLCFCCSYYGNNDLFTPKLETLIESNGGHIKNRIVNDNKTVLQFILDNPDYKVKSGQLESRTILRIEKDINTILPKDTLFRISHNCTQGKEIYEAETKGVFAC